MNSKLIAQCGMNCALCAAYLREKNKCPGCRINCSSKPVTRVRCKIKNCDVIRKNKWKFCSSKCAGFPCDVLDRLDKRYTKKYGMSMIENLNNLEEKGVKSFLKSEEKKWIKGSKIFCVHNKRYYKLGENNERK